MRHDMHLALYSTYVFGKQHLFLNLRWKASPPNLALLTWLLVPLVGQLSTRNIEPSVASSLWLLGQQHLPPGVWSIYALPTPSSRKSSRSNSPKNPRGWVWRPWSVCPAPASSVPALSPALLFQWRASAFGGERVDSVHLHEYSPCFAQLLARGQPS